MSYNAFIKRSTRRYKGYEITPWAIYKDGDPVIIMASKLGGCVEDTLEESKQIVDEHIKKWGK